MGTKTSIEWTDHTFNPWIGCAKVSAGCQHCYAETLSKRWGQRLWGPGRRQVTSGAYWKQPARWNREAEKAGVRRRVFCGSMCDVLEDHEDAVMPRIGLCEQIEATPWLDWLLLTKRPENQPRLWPGSCAKQPNIWWGTSIEDQASADQRIPRLLAIPAASVRFLSIEPLLGPVRPILAVWNFDVIYGVHREAGQRVGPIGGATMRCVDWIIVGGESGGDARPMKIAWARALRDQCQEAGVPFFMKQLGRRPVTVCPTCHGDPPDLVYVTADDGERIKLPGCSGCGYSGLALAPIHDPKGGDMAEWPKDLRVREFPVAVTAQKG